MTDICVCVFLACNRFIYWTQKPDGQTEREKERQGFSKYMDKRNKQASVCHVNCM